MCSKRCYASGFGKGGPDHRRRGVSIVKELDMPDVVIVGGGIGGLTAAACLTQAGFRVQLFEQARQFGEVGAGVQLGPNATRVLGRLSLGDSLGDVCLRPDAVRLLRWEDSSVLTEQPLAAAAEREFGSPYYTLYRPDLVDLLFKWALYDREPLAQWSTATTTLLGDACH